LTAAAASLPADTDVAVFIVFCGKILVPNLLKRLFPVPARRRAGAANGKWNRDFWWNPIFITVSRHRTPVKGVER